MQNLYRGVFGHQYCLEKSLWWLACGLQIGLWTLYRKFDFSFEGSIGHFQNIIIVAICT